MTHTVVEIDGKLQTGCGILLDGFTAPKGALSVSFYEPNPPKGICPKCWHPWGQFANEVAVRRHAASLVR